MVGILIHVYSIYMIWICNLNNNFKLHHSSLNFPVNFHKNGNELLNSCDEL